MQEIKDLIESLKDTDFTKIRILHKETVLYFEREVKEKEVLVQPEPPVVEEMVNEQLGKEEYKDVFERAKEKDQELLHTLIYDHELALDLEEQGIVEFSDSGYVYRD